MAEILPGMQAITAEYRSATESRGARIVVKSWAGRRTYPFDYAEPDPMLHAASQELARLQCDGMVVGASFIASGSLPSGAGAAYIVGYPTRDA